MSSIAAEDFSFVHFVIKKLLIQDLRNGDQLYFSDPEYLSINTYLLCENT